MADYEFLTVENIPDYIRSTPTLAEVIDPDDLVLCDEIGDGNLNLVFLAKGAGMTLLVTAISVVLGTILGVIFGVFRTQVGPVWAAPLTFVLDVFRSIPLLIQLVLANAFMGMVLRLQLSGFTIACGVLTLYTAAYCAEIVRGAIGAVLGHWLNVIRPAGEIEQARKNIEQDLWSRVQAGQFQVAPGVPAPQTEAEAEQQVATVVGQYDKDLAKMRNRNTLFWIPMQFASAGLAVIGLVVMAISAFGMVTG